MSPVILLFFFHLQTGKTPLMLAYSSRIYCSAKVRYLARKGADCEAKDHVRCCLFVTKSMNESPSSLFRMGRQLCFMPPNIIQSIQMIFFNILSLKKALT